MGAITHNGEVLQSLPADASQINFDKTGTNLNSTQTEAAIKEVNTKVNANTDDITQLKSGLTNYITTDTKTASSDTVVANSDKLFTIDVSKTGYVPIFYNVMTTGHSRVLPYYYSLSGNTLSVAVHNFTSDDIAVALEVLVMYKSA